MEVLTHTKRRDFLNCPRYYWLRHEQKLRPKMEKRGRIRGTAFGSAIFAVAEVAEEHEQSGFQDAPAIEDVIRESIQASYSGINPSNQEEASEFELEQAQLFPLISGYIAKYGIEKGKREVVFDQPLVNPQTGKRSRTFRRGGKIDGLKLIGPGRWRVIEDKLVGQIQKPMIDRLPLDMQSNEYVDALLQLGLQAEIAYRHTLMPQSAPKLVGSGANRRRESLDEYIERLTADIVERPDHYYDQQILQFPQDRMEDYRAGRWGTARKIMDARLMVKRFGFQVAFPMNPSKCWEYGGCEYIPLCTRGVEAMPLYVTDDRENPELERGSSADNAAE